MGRWRLALTLTSPHLTVSRNLLPPADFASTTSTWTPRQGAPVKGVLRLGSLDNLVVVLKQSPAPGSAASATPTPPAQRRSLLSRRVGRSQRS